MALRLYIKQAIQYNIQGTQIVYVGTNPNTLQPVIGGQLSNARQWPNYGSYIDVTDEVSDLTNLTLTWTEERDNNGQQTAGTLHTRRSASGKLTFEGQAYNLLKQWLINDVSAPLNAVSVKIEDTGCGIFEDYQIVAHDLKWCEEGVDAVNLCVFDTVIKQNEDPVACIERTIISDNWQGWFGGLEVDNSVFPPKVIGGRIHPRFSYCVEQRPNGMMVMLWYISAISMAPVMVIVLAVATIINLIIGVINIIIGFIHTIMAIIGGNDIADVKWDTIPYIDYKGILNAFGAYFVESAGCGREHPAPLVRDYITNVCKKCNVEVDAVTAPIFFAPSTTIETSSRGIINTINHHYNACYFYAPRKRGVRRYDSVGIFNQKRNNSIWYIPENRPLLTGAEFLDDLKMLYNAEWRVRNVNGKPTLYFQRKDFFLQGNYLLDFTHGDDRMKLLQGICFEWNTIKYPVYFEGIYKNDPTDNCGNTALKYMNTVVNFDSSGTNPMFKGKQLVESKFGATKFRLDGADTDYLYDAMQIVVNSSFLVGFVAGFMFDVVGAAFIEFCDYALLLQDEQAAQPKILIWDGQNIFEGNARCVMPFVGHSELPAGHLPPPPVNTKYNAAGSPWQVIHPNTDETFVRGSSLTIPPNHKGFYTVTDFFGAREIKQPVRLVNYFMYCEEQFQDTMWDWFHWIEDPVKNPSMHQNWTAIMELCCDTIQTLDLVNGGTSALGEKVKLPLQYFTDGRITEIELNYSTEPPLGQHIIIKGNV